MKRLFCGVLLLVAVMGVAWADNWIPTDDKNTNWIDQDSVKTDQNGLIHFYRTIGDTAQVVTENQKKNYYQEYALDCSHKKLYVVMESGRRVLPDWQTHPVAWNFEHYMPIFCQKASD